MEISELPADLQKAVAFHGHLCPGLMIGWRLVRAAQKALEIGSSDDEELVAVVENDSCSVDAAQALLSTTFGKGNLKWRDHGKQVFTVIDRKQNRAVRVAFIGEGLKTKDAQGKTDRRAFMRALLEAPDEKLLTVREIAPQPPEPARIEPSLICPACGEPVQESKTVATSDGRRLCRPCAEEARP